MNIPNTSDYPVFLPELARFREAEGGCRSELELQRLLVLSTEADLRARVRRLWEFIHSLTRGTE